VNRFRAQFIASLLLGASACLQAATDPVPVGLDFFEKRIRPLFAENCVECHGVDKQKGDLRLDSRPGWTKGGASGTALVPGKPDDSLLISAVRYWDKNLQMPPKHSLGPEEVKDLIDWVKLGAPDPRNEAPAAQPAKAAPKIDLQKAREHWAFQPIKNPSPPSVEDEGWVRNDIDRFIMAKLEKADVRPAPDADDRTLLRRVTFDLTGLPPTPAEIADFVGDKSSGAFAKVVDRLLASPRYGERWGRHWLDIARYADTCGNASDFPIPQAYKYRDYVLQAFNDDLPFDQFVREQLAGDLLPATNEAERERHIVATGYLASARHFAGGEGEPHLTIEDAIDNTSRAFLGLTVTCARCHDHKFDPISAHDYYALYGIFSSTIFPHPGSEGKNRPANLVPLASAQDIETLTKTRNEQLAALEVEKKAADEAKAAAEKAPESPEKKGQVEAAAKVAAEVRARRQRLAETPLYPLAYAVSEGKPADAHLQVRGDPKRLGEEVPRGFLQILGGQILPPATASSGRLQLAQWITDPKNPLTARVLANRMWQFHFGRGLVASPNDFGTRGQPPSNPELLDFLAQKLVQGGWSMKAMHRAILLSRTWQLSSTVNVPGDPTNALWSRADRQRLDAESIRDTMLYVSSDLDLRPGGEHPFPPVNTWGFTQHNQFFARYDTLQRTVFQMQQRLRRHPFLALFDGPDPNSSTPLRASSTTPLQSLFAMNDPFIHERAAHLAAAVFQRATDEAQRIELAFLTLYARPPAPDETTMAEAFLTKLAVQKKLPPDQAWASLARVLLSANEFFYVD
jgi:hypothetical protein